MIYAPPVRGLSGLPASSPAAARAWSGPPQRRARGLQPCLARVRGDPMCFRSNKNESNINVNINIDINMKYTYIDVDIDRDIDVNVDFNINMNVNIDIDIDISLNQHPPMYLY